MALWTWWNGDTLPLLGPNPDFRATVERNADLLVRLTSLERAEVRARLAGGHRAYVAWIGETPVAYGWAASLTAGIGELDLAFSIAAEDCYLWDFATLPEWRGRGIYPRLLQAILTAEGRRADRFWIINAPENRASAAGIAKAGFQPVGELSFLPDRAVGSLPADAGVRTRIGAALIGVPLIEAVEAGHVLSPCWRCVIAAKRGDGDAACWPYRDGIAVACTCA
jgi:GNAT superfamily N-acetyltransferase